MQILLNADYIFFSNIFDGKNEDDIVGLNNISTNFLIRQYWENMEKINMLSGEIETFLFQEIQRQIFFIHGMKYYEKTKNEKIINFLPFKLPEKITISSAYDYIKKSPFNESEKKSLEIVGYLEIAYDLCKKGMEYMKNEKNIKQNINGHFSLNAFIKFMLNLSQDININKIEQLLFHEAYETYKDIDILSKKIAAIINHICFEVRRGDLVV